MSEIPTVTFQILGPNEGVIVPYQWNGSDRGLWTDEKR